MSIPKIIHQTAATANQSAGCQLWRQRIVNLHSDWDCRFYDNAANREIIQQEIPDLVPLYDKYPFDIQRVDLFRIVIIYISGGFYMDMDMECHKPLDPLCRYVCVLGEEKILISKDAARLSRPNTLRVANYMFGSEPGHPFWLEVLEEMLRQAERNILTEDDILESTGPGLLTNVYHRVKNDYLDLLLLKNNHLLCRKCNAISCQFGDFASHLHMGSWRWANSIFPFQDGKIDVSSSSNVTTIGL